jgi:hypothetical protein
VFPFASEVSLIFGISSKIEEMVFSKVRLFNLKSYEIYLLLLASKIQLNGGNPILVSFLAKSTFFIYFFISPIIRNL